MNGKMDLNEILKTLSPELNDGEYIFFTNTENIKIDDVNIIMLFKEKEGETYILERNIADKMQINYESSFAWITLKVHSHLESVGLTAAFSNMLAKGNISCNVIAGYYHDHIFVPYEKKDQALDLLKNISENL